MATKNMIKCQIFFLYSPSFTVELVWRAGASTSNRCNPIRWCFFGYPMWMSSWEINSIENGSIGPDTFKSAKLLSKSENPNEKTVFRWSTRKNKIHKGMGKVNKDTNYNIVFYKLVCLTLTFFELVF